MTVSSGWPGLRGRRSECESLISLLGAARNGQSQVIVLCGDAGIGKTALLQFLLDNADGYGVSRTAGVESEMELAFASLHQLCIPFLDRLDRLPLPQRTALDTTFGHYARDRLEDEPFGDFVIRAGYVKEVKAGRDFNS